MLEPTHPERITWIVCGAVAALCGWLLWGLYTAAPPTTIDTGHRRPAAPGQHDTSAPDTGEARPVAGQETA